MLSGVLFLLSFPPFDLWPLIGIALVPILVVRRGLSTQRLFVAAYAMAGIPVTGIGYGIAIAHLGAFVVIALGVPAAFAVAVVVADAVERRVATASGRLLTFPAVAVTVEYLLSAGFEAPATISLALAPAPLLIQSADLFGTPGTTFLIILVNAGLARALVWAAARYRGETTGSSDLGVAIAAATILMANVAYGHLALHHYGDLAPSVRVAAVQPAISSEAYRDRWFHREAQTAIDAAVDALVHDALALKPALLFLSEGSDGRYRFRVPHLRRRTETLARRSGVGLLVSSPDMTPEGDELNAVFSVGPGGSLLGRYAKQVLTPVGEEYLTRGSERHPLVTKVGKVGAMVCFESCFASVARDLVRQGAEFLLVTTSDAAFRNGSLPLLHTAFSVFRAIETRRFVVQAANTGPSLVVGPTGAVAARTPFLVPALLTGVIEPLRGSSVYSRVGDLLPWAAIAGLLVGVARGRRAGPWFPARTRAPRGAPGALRRSSIRTLAYGAGYGVLVATLIVCSIALSSSNGDESANPTASVGRFLRTPAVPASYQPAGHFLQRRANTCGPAALAFALAYYDVAMSEEEITALIHLEDRGTNLGELARAAEHAGMRAVGTMMNLAALRLRRQPTVVHVAHDHFVVVIEIADDRVLLFDPAKGLIRMPVSTFARHWDGRALVLYFRPIIELDGTTRAALAPTGEEES